MNIVYIHTHDTGRYIEPYGYAVKMPNLMQLSQEGVLFRQAFSAAPSCSPSRSAMMTGMSPHSCGMNGLAHYGFSLTDYDKHLAHFLKTKGYETVLCGISHEGGPIDYDHVLSEKIPFNVDIKANVEWDAQNAHTVAEYIKKPKDKPFFLSFGMFALHRVYPSHEEGDVDANHVTPPFPIHDNPRTRKDMADYIHYAGLVDEWVGLVLESIREAGLEEETIIIFSTDHGMAFPKMKASLYDTGIEISLIMKYLGNPKQGNTIDALVSQIDLFPTLCDMVGLEKPEWLEGQSLIPILNGETEEVNEEIYAEMSYHGSYEPMRAIRTKRYKLIKHLDTHLNVVPANMDDSPSKDHFIESDWLDTQKERDELFDLYLDPAERVSLVNDKKYEEVYNGLNTRLQYWMEQSNDPILQGRIPKLKGATVIKQSVVSSKSTDWEEHFPGDYK